nr:CmpA/NrtA family ABC transporter substrate-binding protein [uncultured Dongia sp.]
MSMNGKTVSVRAGFMPLLDAAILIVTSEKGFAEEQGLALQLERETSWANIRDRIAIGHFDVAHMLAPMPIAASLGLTSLAVPMIVPMALGLGGNAVTVSNTLWHALAARGAPNNGDPARVGAALKTHIANRRTKGEAPLTLAIVHPFSGHNYELRYWLAACGIDPENDVALTVVPPPFMPDALAAGRIDGYCVGEPWNTAAIAAGAGRIATTKAAIWRSSPEKVIGMRADWTEQNRETVTRLMAAMYHAAGWCDNVANHAELARLLSQPNYLDLPADLLLPGLSNQISLGSAAPQEVQDFLFFERKAATFPWISHALWFFTQMVHWGQATSSAAALNAVRRTYRPDIYREALGPLGVILPGGSSKVEGALLSETQMSASGGTLRLGPDGFFDGRAFDPDKLAPYLDSLPFGVKTSRPAPNL